MDVYYVDHVSFKMDLKILIKTILIVIKKEGKAFFYIEVVMVMENLIHI